MHEIFATGRSKAINHGKGNLPIHTPLHAKQVLKIFFAFSKGVHALLGSLAKAIFAQANVSDSVGHQNHICLICSSAINMSNYNIY